MLNLKRKQLNTPVGEYNELRLPSTRSAKFLHSWIANGGRYSMNMFSWSHWHSFQNLIQTHDSNHLENGHVFWQQHKATHFIKIWHIADAWVLSLGARAGKSEWNLHFQKRSAKIMKHNSECLRLQMHRIKYKCYTQILSNNEVQYLASVPGM